MMSQATLWDLLSTDYDRFVDWQGRLATEMPFLESLFAEHGVQRVLDVGCGTGRHAIALAERGYEVLGMDASEGMVSQARRNAAAAGVKVQFLQAGFGELNAAAGDSFDALLCLGNSLPSVLGDDELERALADMAKTLVPRGSLIVQNLNYDRVWARRERFMPLQAHHRGDEEWLFVRFVDFHSETLTFNMIILHKDGAGWHCRPGAAELRPIFKDDLAHLLKQTRFVSMDFYGDYNLNPYHQDTSGDLIVVAHTDLVAT